MSPDAELGPDDTGPSADTPERKPASTVYRRRLVDLNDLTDAEAAELLALTLENRRRAQEMEAEQAQELADELAELEAEGETPTIGTYRRHGIRPQPRPNAPDEWLAGDLERRIPRTISEIARYCQVIPFRTALVAVADHLLDLGCDPVKVRDAFAEVLTGDEP